MNPYEPPQEFTKQCRYRKGPRMEPADIAFITWFIVGSCLIAMGAICGLIIKLYS